MLTVRDTGGTYGEANRKAVYEPFSKETGINVESPCTRRCWHRSRKAAVRPHRHRHERTGAFRGGRRHAGARLRPAEERGGGAAASPSHSSPPTTRRAFPGSRALQSPDAGPPEPEFAILADGVPLDRLYPLAVGRAFRALDAIKEDVREFWTDSATPGLLLERGQVALSSVWHGRPNELIKQGAPLAYQWNGARRQSSGFGIPNGARNVDAAYQLIDFALRPEVQSDFAEVYPMGPVVPAAYKYLPRAAADLASSPEHLYTGFDLDVDWWVKYKADRLRPDASGSLLVYGRCARCST